MSPEQIAMVAFARARLEDGRSPGQTFADMVGVSVPPRPAAVAVCVAAGTPVEAAELRVREFDSVVDALPSDQEAAGSILEEHGLFDVEVVLDATQAQAAAELRQAVSAVGWMPGAHAFFRQLRTGALLPALESLEDLGSLRWPENREFWVHLARAAEAIGPAAADIGRRCADRS